MDAAEQLLLEEGYAAVTSRRVGAKAGLKPQLVHYYFRTMDDLFVEVFRRHADADLARVRAGGGRRRIAAQSVAAQLGSAGAAFSIEFVALAKHRKAIRAEIARYAERYRAAQLDALTEALDAAGVTEEQLPPIVALLLVTGLSQVMSLEGALGVTAGHDATAAFVEDLLARLEPAP